MYRNNDCSDFWRWTLIAFAITVVAVSALAPTIITASDTNSTGYVQFGVQKRQLQLPLAQHRRAPPPRPLSHLQQTQILNDIREHHTLQQQAVDGVTHNHTQLRQQPVWSSRAKEARYQTVDDVTHNQTQLQQQPVWSSRAKEARYVTPQAISQASFLIPQQPQASFIAPQQPQASFIAPQQPQASFIAPQQPQASFIAPQQPQASFIVPQQQQRSVDDSPVYKSHPNTPLKSPAENTRPTAESRGSNQDLFHLSNDRHQLFKEIESQTNQQQLSLAPRRPKQNQQHLQEQLQKQFQEQLFQRQELLRQLKQTISESISPGEDLPEANPTTRKTTLNLNYYEKQLQSRANNDISPSRSSSNSNQIKTVSAAPLTTAKPWSLSFEELSKGVLPQGAQFEVIRHSGDDKLEEIGKLPANLPDKNVTFVFLEEQADGTFKVQGIKGGNNTDQQDGDGDVNSIIKKIQDGDLKLPPSTRLHSGVAAESSPEIAFANPTPNYKPSHQVPSNVQAVTFPTTTAGAYNKNLWSITERSPVLVTAQSSYETSTWTPQRSDLLSRPSQSSTSPPKKKPQSTFLPTIQTFLPSDRPNPVGLNRNQNAYQTTEELQPAYSSSQRDDEFLQRPYRRLPHSGVNAANVTDPLVAAVVPTSDETLTTSDILKKEGLFAMAKFLRDSGLDNVIHNKGPFTLFAPTDKAFRALFEQLGGTEKAMTKFRENPRLLSGLLLHHVIPGVFRIDSLLDEMTGVSLAGTQLRVNTYTVQDNKWADTQMVTINGARVLKEKQDLVLAHGSVAHAIDRVMFPLPVGDLMLTLQADRTRRFGKFLRLMKTARISDLVTSSSSVTLFAPTDDAFSIMAPEDVERLMADREMARALVLRHIAPGALYSVGMKYFQERASMLDGQPITVYKKEGQVKVNTANVVTYNTPATNGVIHAISGLL